MIETTDLLHDRVVIHETRDERRLASFAEEVRRGLSATPKRLSPTYLYDDLGSALFEAICELPEYDLTRNEVAILDQHLGEMLLAAGEGADLDLVELGSGSARKSRLVVERLLRRQAAVEYHAIDVSATTVIAAAQTLVRAFDGLRVHAHVADYLSELGRKTLRGDRATLVLFLGSNIGNYEPAEARALLRTVARAFEPGDALFLGTDLKKDAATLELAYDDPTGVTKAFVKNILGRINRELGGDFDPRSFRHVARYDAERGSVDAFLESSSTQNVVVADLGTTFAFARGERIHVESSYKFSISEVIALAEGLGVAI